jgi:hypothetical protein
MKARCEPVVARFNPTTPFDLAEEAVDQFASAIEVAAAVRFRLGGMFAHAPCPLTNVLIQSASNPRSAGRIAPDFSADRRVSADGCGALRQRRVRSTSDCHRLARGKERAAPHDRVGFAAVPHQIRTRFSGARKSLSLGLTLKALYQASMLRTTPSTRYFTGAWALETSCWRIESSVDFWRQLWA